MRHKFIEASNPSSLDRCDGFNYGKFLLIQFDEEDRKYKSQVEVPPEYEEAQRRYPLLTQIGFSKANIFVIDLQTKEGAAFVPGGYAEADLAHHAVWVCPMFSPFLEWLYKQSFASIHDLPATVKLVGAAASFRGYRRDGEAFIDGEGI